MSNAGAPAFRPCGRVHVPRGQFLALQGRLSPSPTQPRHLYRLRTQDGAHWFLHSFRRVDHLLGRDVCIEGTRSDFATIDVDRIWPVGAPRPMFLRERLARGWNRRLY